MKKIFITIAITLSLATSVAMSQTINPNIQATTPDSRFAENGDETVTDLVTGLMWKKSHESGTYTWQEALQKAETVNSGGGFAGYADWRVPNAKELKSIVEEKCYDPAINLTVFPGTPSYYFWSSSTVAYDGIYAWFVNFNNSGDDFYKKTDSDYVRLVRGGQ